MAESWPLALLQVLQNSGSQMFIFSPCQREIATDKIQERTWKNYRERSNIKNARQCTDVPRKMAVALQKDSVSNGNRTHVSRLSTTSLNHSAIGSYQWLKKNCIWIVILLELFCTAFLGLTLAELHVRVLTSFVKLIKLLQTLMKLLPNHTMVW